MLANGKTKVSTVGSDDYRAIIKLWKTVKSQKEHHLYCLNKGITTPYNMRKTLKKNLQNWIEAGASAKKVTSFESYAKTVKEKTTPLIESKR